MKSYIKYKQHVPGTGRREEPKQELRTLPFLVKWCLVSKPRSRMSFSISTASFYTVESVVFISVLSNFVKSYFTMKTRIFSLSAFLPWNIEWPSLESTLEQTTVINQKACKLESIQNRDSRTVGRLEELDNYLNTLQ